MAKRSRRRRKFRRYLKGKLDERLLLSTLAAKTVVGANATGVLEEKAWLSSVKALYSLNDFTQIVDVGPIMIGLAHNSYSDAEIEAWVENEAGSWAAGSEVAQEIAKRKIRQIGIFMVPVGATTGDIVTLNDGRPIRTKCGWMLQTGDTVKLWVYNTGLAAVATTVPKVVQIGHANLWPA